MLDHGILDKGGDSLILLSLQTPPAMHCMLRGFVEHFFQCSDCAKHFVGMATEKSALTVQSRREAVLWMWQAHNRVGAQCWMWQNIITSSRKWHMDAALTQDRWKARPASSMSPIKLKFFEEAFGPDLDGEWYD